MSDHEINGVEHKTAELLPFVDDDYGGVNVEMKTPMDPKCFVAALRFSFVQWRLQGKKGVWLNLPLSHVNLVEPAVKEGFRYHHAEPTYLMLVYWIPEAESTIPSNASHRVRVGAVVLNHNKEILVVQEKYGTLRGSGIWKIPTGVVDKGEEIFAAAIREVSASQPITHKNDLYKVIHRICSMKMENSYNGFSTMRITSFFDDKLGYLYWNKQDINNPIS